MTSVSDSDVPPQFWHGVEQFNQGEFYACHDTLEAIWMEAMEPNRTFYQGILQIAVALYHLGNYNWQGSVTLMADGLRRLSAYTPDYADVNLSPFLDTTQLLLQTLQHGGPEQVDAIAHHIHAAYPASTLAPSERTPRSPADPDSDHISRGKTSGAGEVSQLALRSPKIERMIEA